MSLNVIVYPSVNIILSIQIYIYVDNEWNKAKRITWKYDHSAG